MARVPPSDSPVWAASVLAMLAFALSLTGTSATDISQILSQVTAVVALYVVGGGPKGPNALEAGKQPPLG